MDPNLSQELYFVEVAFSNSDIFIKPLHNSFTSSFWAFYKSTAIIKLLNENISYAVLWIVIPYPWFNLNIDISGIFPDLLLGWNPKFDGNVQHTGLLLSIFNWRIS